MPLLVNHRSDGKERSDRVVDSISALNIPMIHSLVGQYPFILHLLFRVALASAVGRQHHPPMREQHSAELLHSLVLIKPMESSPRSNKVNRSILQRGYLCRSIDGAQLRILLFEPHTDRPHLGIRLDRRNWIAIL